MSSQPAAREAVLGHVRRTLTELAQLDEMSVSLGGLISARDGALTISELHGLRHTLFQGALIGPGVGLGGVAMQRRRPVAVTDYVESPMITHQFDRAAEADQLKGAVALPVVVRGGLRAIVYGATRGERPLGERTVATAAVAARKLAHDIEVEDVAQARIRRALEERAVAETEVLSRSELAEVNAELVAVASAVGDPQLRARLLALSRRMSAKRNAATDRPAVRLSERERDVLVQVSAGYTNAEIAERLCVLPTTVKTHLRNTMRKLGARNRVETLSAARNARLLP